MMSEYDLVIIGAGWAGFNASIRAKGLGLKVCLIDKGQLGGTCLNQGCIPTKILIQSAKIYSLAKKTNNFGIDIAGVPFVNIPEIQQRKEKIIRQLRQGMQFMLQGIDFLNAEAQLLSPTEVKVQDRVLKSKFILIATGARPAELPFLKFDPKRVYSSNEMLNLDKVPQNLLVIGGGAIGCEFASLFAALGSRVSIMEKMPQILPGLDQEVARKLGGIFKKRGINVQTNADAAGVDLKAYDIVLLCVGRTPETRGLNLDEIGVKLEKNKILADDYLRTNISNIFAAGDCTANIMLAHFAAYQGRLVVENIVFGKSPKKETCANIPNCIFTDPEIAAVGLSEEEAKEKNMEIEVHKFDFLGSGMACILGETEGFIKIISEKKTQVILGGSVIGARSTELIAILTLCVTHRLRVAQIQETVFAHPTLSEAIGDALKREHGV